MRTALFIAAVLITPLAFAQEATMKPSTPPPAASASFEQREAWCEDYATWFIASTPTTATAQAPADVRLSHEFEVEFSSCKIDPQQYEHDTREEVERQSRARLI